MPTAFHESWGEGEDDSIRKQQHLASLNMKPNHHPLPLLQSFRRSVVTRCLNDNSDDFPPPAPRLSSMSNPACPKAGSTPSHGGSTRTCESSTSSSWCLSCPSSPRGKPPISAPATRLTLLQFRRIHDERLAVRQPV